VVQFGAFTDSARAHEARVKVEKTGLKTYAQVADTPDGKKFRVRVGPFEKRTDAEKAAEKIKKLDLPAAILAL
jgi:DedD protein